MKSTDPDISDLLLDAICTVDPQGNFLSIRGACEAIFGYRPEEMVGKPMIGFVWEPDRPRTLQAVQRVMDGYLQRHFENRYVRKDGRLVHIMWSARWSPEDNMRVAVARDVTRRRDSQDTPGLSAIPLSAQDYTVLRALARDVPCVSRKDIVGALGEDYLQYDQRRLDTQMRRLRRKVEEASGLKLPVATLRGAGFRFYQPIDVIVE
ncbi:MAG: domain S-box protein [Ramlibacter sp.]|nr:domain S-box protein [Ramlibacter sp.]